MYAARVDDAVSAGSINVSFALLLVLYREYRKYSIDRVRRPARCSLSRDRIDQNQRPAATLLATRAGTSGRFVKNCIDHRQR